MKRTNRLLLLVTLILTTSASFGQTLDEVLTKHIAALGGKDKLSSISSVIMENTVQMMGNDVAGKVTILNGKGYRNEFEYNGSPVVQVVTEKNGWQITPMTGGAEPMNDDMFKNYEEFVYLFPLVNLNNNIGAKVELLGKEKLGDADAFKLKVTNKDSVSTTYFVDANSFYLVQTIRSSEFMGNIVDLITSYSDFKTTDAGVVLPMASETNFGAQFAISSKTNKVQFNIPVDATIFDMK